MGFGQALHGLIDCRHDTASCDSSHVPVDHDIVTGAEASHDDGPCPICLVASQPQDVSPTCPPTTHPLLAATPSVECVPFVPRPLLTAGAPRAPPRPATV
jgi:hypothetical protein